MSIEFNHTLVHAKDTWVAAREAKAHGVPLREELEFIQRYLEIEGHRFEDRLREAVPTPAPGGDVPERILATYARLDNPLFDALADPDQLLDLLDGMVDLVFAEIAMPSEPVESGCSARIARPAFVSSDGLATTRPPNASMR